MLGVPLLGWHGATVEGIEGVGAYVYELGGQSFVIQAERVIIRDSFRILNDTSGFGSKGIMDIGTFLQHWRFGGFNAIYRSLP